MKILIDINEHTINCAKCGQGIGWMSNAQLEEAIKNGVEIPDNATNGEIFTKMFPHYTIEIESLEGFVRCSYSGWYIRLPIVWWDAPYKENDTDGMQMAND